MFTRYRSQIKVFPCFRLFRHHVRLPRRRALPLRHSCPSPLFEIGVMFYYARLLSASRGVVLVRATKTLFPVLVARTATTIGAPPMVLVPGQASSDSRSVEPKVELNYGDAPHARQDDEHLAWVMIEMVGQYKLNTYFH
jgi:hypothetical protein